jgi:glycosyltransferase involved in cell wall biosynthesis
MPLVSVIVPTCGRPQLLLDCVASILRNDFQDFEIIIVDQDPTCTLRAALARRFEGDKRLVYVFLDIANLSRARNVGLLRARGDIVVFSDDDVEVAPGWLSAYVEAFDACGGPGVVGGRLSPRWLTPKPPWLPASKEYLLGIYDKADGLTLMPELDLPIGANFAAHRKVVDTVGPFDERLGYSYERKRGMIGGEDSLFSLRARQARYPLYHQSAARAWHKISAGKLSRRYFVRRSYWEGVTQLTVLHLAGSVTIDQCFAVAHWHARTIVHWGRRLARIVLRWTRRPNPAQEAMEAISFMANSAGIIRAALKLRATGQLPW